MSVCSVAAKCEYTCAAGYAKNENGVCTLIPTCENSAVDLPPSNITFSANADCRWLTNDNLGTKDKYLQARAEQVFPISLPSTSTLCSMKLESTVQAEFKYDDHLFLALNEKVLMTTSAPSLTYLAPTDANGNYVYNWFSLRGKYVDNDKSSIYCNGAGSICTLPNTDTVGTLSISIDGNAIQKIAPTSAGYQLKMVVTGDDNTTKDCRHTAVTFKVTGKHCPNCAGGGSTVPTCSPGTQSTTGCDPVMNGISYKTCSNTGGISGGACQISCNKGYKLNSSGTGCILDISDSNLPTM